MKLSIVLIGTCVAATFAAPVMEDRSFNPAGIEVVSTYLCMLRIHRNSCIRSAANAVGTSGNVAATMRSAATAAGLSGSANVTKTSAM
jgi:hypothetical protein